MLQEQHRSSLACLGSRQQQWTPHGYHGSLRGKKEIEFIVILPGPTATHMQVCVCVCVWGGGGGGGGGWEDS